MRRSLRGYRESDLSEMPLPGERGLVAVKIDELGFYDLLAAKMDSVQTPGPQPRPQFVLRGGHFVAHFNGALEFGGTD